MLPQGKEMAHILVCLSYTKRSRSTDESQRLGVIYFVVPTVCTYVGLVTVEYL